VTLHPRALIVSGAFGLVLWLAADLRVAIAAVVATAAFDWMTLTSLAGHRRR
jgi:hypothetical protein